MSPLLRLALALLLFTSVIHGQSNEAGLRARLLNKQFLLRGCWQGNNLWFSGNGGPLNDYPELPFTLSGVRVDKIKLSHNALDIDAHRMGLEIDAKAHGSLRWTPIVLTDAAQDKTASDSLHIHITAPANSDYTQPLDVIFAESVTDIAPRLPDYWQPAAKHFFGFTDTPVRSADRLHGPDLSALKTLGAFSGSSTPPQASGNMVPPALLSGVNPEFTPAARHLKYRASVVVNFTVEADGSVTHPEIIAPAGLGLDEAAIAAVLKYKFKPGTLDGKPKSMQIGSSVSFEVF